MTTTYSAHSAASHGLLSCHACHLLCRHGDCGSDPRCPRCRTHLHARKPASLALTWSLVILSYLFYIPANMLPMLETHELATFRQNTILSGIALFWDDGSWFIAGIIFIASIVVPLSKLIALTALLMSVHRRSEWEPAQRTQLYRLVEAVGRWSMLDVYVVSLSVALVQLGAVASMIVGPAALAFGAVVVLTMLASHTFDPRLMWDAAQQAERGAHGHG
jgi:paraquat-inducible protein A